MFLQSPGKGVFCSLKGAEEDGGATVEGEIDPRGLGFKKGLGMFHWPVSPCYCEVGLRHNRTVYFQSLESV